MAPVGAGCAVCGAAADAASETAEVASNVRAHRAQRFVVWRCAACASIHARDPVDLDHYYRDYPLLRTRDSRVLRYFQRRLWRRLERAGARPEHAVLDYGCGAGLLVDELRRRGYAGATGYDAYSPRFADPAVLDLRHDVVFSQDVIEHVDAPLALLDTFGRLCRPGGLIAIGTPDAAAIDLRRAAHHKHSLHQPYHRHILTHAALLAAGRARGWQLVRHHRRAHTSTAVPTLNLPYLLRYLRAGDDTLDVAFDPPRLSWRMITPPALFDALFGALRGPHTEGMTIFRTPPAALPA